MHKVSPFLSLFFLFFPPLITFVAENKREKVIILNVFSGIYARAARIPLTPSVLFLRLLKRSDATVIIIQSHQWSTLLLEWDGN